MAKTTQELQTAAVTIRDEQTEAANTALRVGTLFVDLINRGDGDRTELAAELASLRSDLSSETAQRRLAIASLTDRVTRAEQRLAALEQSAATAIAVDTRRATVTLTNARGDTLSTAHLPAASAGGGATAWE